MPAPPQAQTELFPESHAGLSSQISDASVSTKPNPVFVSIQPPYVEALKALGYSESEARFLYLVATHPGYFVVRQFLAFTRGHWGKRTTAFWHKLHTKKHARTEYFPMRGKVCHVFSRKLYGQIGIENLRNRREHEFEYIQFPCVPSRERKYFEKKNLWRKRVGVEPTPESAKDTGYGFEDHEDHRAPFASASSIEEAFGGLKAVPQDGEVQARWETSAEAWFVRMRAETRS